MKDVKVMTPMSDDIMTIEMSLRITLPKDRVVSVINLFKLFKVPLSVIGNILIAIMYFLGKILKSSFL